MKKVVVISTSLRVGSNSQVLAEQFAEGAKTAGHQVEFISLRGKEIKFCVGCLACQMLGACVIKDDVPAIMEQVLNADVVCWATPIYYYEMSGQMKTLIDRMNAMYPKITISATCICWPLPLKTRKELPNVQKQASLVGLTAIPRAV